MVFKDCVPLSSLRAIFEQRDVPILPLLQSASPPPRSEQEFPESCPAGVQEFSVEQEEPPAASKDLTHGAVDKRRQGKAVDSKMMTPANEMIAD
jgi:hypothetical protein